MQVISKEISIKEYLGTPIVSAICNPCSAFFDIETTGFSAASSTLYLIGIGRILDQKYIVTQFFAETPNDEADVIISFFDYLKKNNINELISFNGLGFDVPYVNNRCMYLGLEYDLSLYKHTDIYKIIVPQKIFLGLKNCKQKTVEQFLKLKRDDIYDGGQLIQVYKHYVRTNDDSALDALLLHNFEDVLGMIDLLPILSYCKNLSSAVDIISVSEKEAEIILSLYVPYFMPRRIEYNFADFNVRFYSNIIDISINKCNGYIKIFYVDYQNYYYLVDEDIAIHKSVAQFVDKSHRVKATSQNCYGKLKVSDGFFDTEDGIKYIQNLLNVLLSMIKKVKK